jgi:hypothetical protein
MQAWWRGKRGMLRRYFNLNRGRKGQERKEINRQEMKEERGT